jgi:hypothetical protein
MTPEQGAEKVSHGRDNGKNYDRDDGLRQESRVTYSPQLTQRAASSGAKSPRSRRCHIGITVRPSGLSTAPNRGRIEVLEYTAKQHLP